MKTRHLLLTAAVLLLPQLSPAATQTVIPAPPGSGLFGEQVVTLPNGNFLVKDSSYNQIDPPVWSISAVHLYDPQGVLISSLVGSGPNQDIGSHGIFVLASGHFVVCSGYWRNGPHGNAGAVTFGHAETGWGVGQVVPVSPDNSLVGSQENDQVGNGGITQLSNGHFVVNSSNWAGSRGAVTWCNGNTGLTGPVSAANSLVGSVTLDRVGASVTALDNGHYVVRSPSWRYNSMSNVGAVTWCDGSTGATGPVTVENSLHGTSAGDLLGNGGIIPLTNNNYVVVSWFCSCGSVITAGAVTWGNGSTGTTGPVTAAKSICGSKLGDHVGLGQVKALANGHYVVLSRSWDNDAVPDVGAVTWGNGETGSAIVVAASNSLIGTRTGDLEGNAYITTLRNGHYVVCSPVWDNGMAVNAGAVTWGNGHSGSSGPISAANSIVGSKAHDSVGSGGVTALANDHFAVASPNWDNGAMENVGAVTWGNGISGSSGAVANANSLVGTQKNDSVGSGGVTALANGHYVVRSPNWDLATVPDAGAVTWGNGYSGSSGPISTSNSLHGSQSMDMVGSGGIIRLTNGHFVVLSPSWKKGGLASAGAISWGNGTKRSSGPVSAMNSLVGSSAYDMLGNSGGTALPNGSYVVCSPNWDNGTKANAGAVTWANGSHGTSGTISTTNSLHGLMENDQIGTSVTALNDGNYLVRSRYWLNGSLIHAGAITLGDGEIGRVGWIEQNFSVAGRANYSGSKMVVAQDTLNRRLVVGDPNANLVTIFTPDRLHAHSKSSQPAPGAENIAFAAPGALAVDAGGGALFEAGLTGSGARTGKRGLFAPGFNGALDLVLRQGDAVAALGLDLPGNAVVASLGGPLRQQAGRGLFQATVKGTGVTAVNNRLLLLDDGIRVRPLLRSGQGITLLSGASVNRTLEVAQSHDQDAIAVTYVLNKGGSTAVTGANDTGLLLLRHDGSTQGIGTGREGAEAFGGGGTFGQFTGRVAAGQGDTVHFSALYQPTVGKAVPALFRTTLDGGTRSRTATVGDAAPGAGGATFASFKGLSQMGADALFTATLKGSPANANEGLWRDDGSPVLTRKGDEVAPGLTITRLLRFWPAGGTRVLLQAQLSNRTQALLLRQENGSYHRLMATGDTPPGVGAAKLKTINAVEADPVTGHYAVLGTLSGAPAAANQALWSGNAALGDESAAGSVYRLPVLRLRKGQTYRTESTPQSVLRGISLRPAVDTSGAGGRGLAQVVGSSGAIGLVLTGDRKLSEVVVLK